jgi:hypothetical protein
MAFVLGGQELGKKLSIATIITLAAGLTSALFL